MTAAFLKSAVLLVATVIVQVVVFAPLDIAGGAADVVLVTVVVVALVAGSVVGAASGFWAGFLLDSASLGTLGFSSLLLTLVGYWAGRYGEVGGRDRAHAPASLVGAATIAYALGGFLLAFMLGEPTSARWMLLDTLLPQLALNVLITLPAFALVRRLLASTLTGRAAQEVELVG